MLKSLFIKSILELLIEGHEEEQTLKAQISLLIESEYLYTGAGLFVSFTLDTDITDKVRFAGVLNGVGITSTVLEHGAQAQLFFHEGNIHYLEIFSNDASYPQEPLPDYCLTQDWLPNGGRIICFP